MNELMKLMFFMAESGVCRLCLEEHHMDFEVITDHTTAILNILHLKMDLSISKEPVMCKSCARNVKMAFGFKSTCLYTEELVMSFACDQHTSHFYLKEVYKELKSLITANDSVCRFCMTCSETSNFTSLDNMIEEGLVSRELLGLYLPEIKKKLWLGIKHIYWFIEKSLKWRCIYVNHVILRRNINRVLKLIFLVHKKKF
ncbi:hypothetical protein NQ317_011667 [Molorchus minor]|uniref:ZAD domain-containing protein n=1 Tax=Molorchus minor TaxID=1323400 RepID=A0ABQ9JFY4_9CUCU|nr:hypothetical protein NQ317_011667 [Molorchus minor]